MRISRSLSARLSTTILLITSALYLVAILTIAYFSQKMIAQEAHKNASNILNATIQDINQTLDKVESSVNNMNWIVTEHLDDTAYLYHITSEIVASNEEIEGSAIAFCADYFKDKHYFSPYSYHDVNSNAIYSKQLGNDNYNYFEMEWFTVPFHTKLPHWCNPYYDEGGGEMMMTTYSYPLLDEDGNVYAIITADISLAWLAEKIRSLHPYKNSFTFLLCKNGVYISGDEFSLVDNQNEKEKYINTDYYLLGEKMASGDSGSLRIKDNREYSFAVYGPLHNGWSTAIISPYKDIFIYLLRMNFIIIIVSTIGLFLLFVLCLRIIKKITQPLTEFSVAALNMAKGNFHARLPQINTKDEMKQLYNSFEYMQKSITLYIKELRSTTAINERMESELNIARNIQLNMVPTKFPNNERYAIHATLQPAKEVGGDFYDFIEVDDEIFFAIGDVSGKGVPAALVMSITRAAFRFLGGINLTIDKMIEKINNTMCQRNNSKMFVTMFAGKINLKTGVMQYCNAGHNPLVIRHPDGRTEFFYAQTNIAVGISNGFSYELEETRLEKGTRLVLYTDGVTEAEDIKKKQYGEQRLLNFVSNLSDSKSAEDLISDLMADVKAFTQDAQPNDDITILTISLK